jgi:hypothetical protein
MMILTKRKVKTKTILKIMRVVLRASLDLKRDWSKVTRLKISEKEH